MKIVDEVQKIVSPVWLVGGSVRDILLNRAPKDYDFTTPLPPDEIEARVKSAGRRAYTVGKKFGTIGFKVPDETGKYQYVEVTTFRRESYKPGSRKPEVEFVNDLKEDLSRRDLTINAIALQNGEYYDPFGGRIDILARKIKAVGEAKDRFKEDPLRMLRVARFASQLDFEVDPNLIGKIRKMPEKILDVSRERWVQEMDKLLMSDIPSKGIQVLYDSYMLKYMLPELNNQLDNLNDWDLNTYWIREMDYKLKVMDATAADQRWGWLLEHIGRSFTDKNPHLIKRELLVGICARLKFSNDRTKYLLN